MFKGPFGDVLWAVLWAYYMSHLALRVKVVIASFCNNLLICCCWINC